MVPIAIGMVYNYDANMMTHHSFKKNSKLELNDDRDELMKEKVSRRVNGEKEIRQQFSFPLVALCDILLLLKPRFVEIYKPGM